MIREHETRDAVAVGDVWGFFGDGHLDGGGTPGNEFCDFTFAHAQEGFVYLVFGCCQFVALIMWCLGLSSYF